MHGAQAEFEAPGPTDGGREPDLTVWGLAVSDVGAIATSGRKRDLEYISLKSDVRVEVVEAVKEGVEAFGEARKHFISKRVERAFGEAAFVRESVVLLRGKPPSEDQVRAMSGRWRAAPQRFGRIAEHRVGR